MRKNQRGQLAEELKEREDKHDDRREEDEDPSIESVGKGKPGPKALPESWTRVIALHAGEQVKVNTHSVFVDKEHQKYQRGQFEPKEGHSWKPAFWPKQHALEHDYSSLDLYRLPDTVLKQWAKRVNRLRET
jgi:hypothetical protein